MNRLAPSGLLLGLALSLTACSDADVNPQSHGGSGDQAVTSAHASSAASRSQQADAEVASQAAGAESSPEPKMLDCLGEGSMVRPATLSLDCQETNATLSKLQWAQWDRDAAKGTGEFSVNNCQPNCAEGTVESYAVEVMAPQVKTSQAGSVYTEVVVTFLDGRPVGSTSRETYELPR